MSYQITLDDRKLKSITRELLPKAQAVINKAAINVQAGATQRTSRVDTGNMKNGWQVELAGGGTRQAKTGENKQRVELPGGGELSAIVGNVMEYAFYHEFGTTVINRLPMLSPAIEAERQKFEQAFKAIVE